jgi:hypothetical protein
LGGTFLSPKPTLLMSEQKEQVKDALTTKAKEEGTALVKDALKNTKAKDVVNNLLGTKQDTVKKDTAKTAAPVQDLLKNKMQNLLKKKKN